MSQSIENEISFRVGGVVGVPPANVKKLFIGSDGLLKTIDSAALIAGVGGFATAYTVGSNVQDFDLPVVLNSTIDGDYILGFQILMPNSVGPTITFQPNQLATNQVSLISAAAAAAGWTFSQLATLPINSTATAASGTPFVRGALRLNVKAGVIRGFALDGTDFTGTATRAIITRGNWTDTATVVTSIRIHSDVAASILTGSVFTLQPTGVFL